MVLLFSSVASRWVRAVPVHPGLVWTQLGAAAAKARVHLSWPVPEITSQNDLRSSYGLNNRLWIAATTWHKQVQEMLPERNLLLQSHLWSGWIAGWSPADKVQTSFNEVKIHYKPWMKQQLREIAFMTLLKPLNQRANSFISTLFICLFIYAQ